MQTENYIIARIEQLCEKKGISRYKLAQKSGIAQSSISTLLNRKSVPTIQTLEKICEGLGITLAQFFAGDEEFPDLTADQKQLLPDWNAMDDHQKELVKRICRALLESKDVCAEDGIARPYFSFGVFMKRYNLLCFVLLLGITLCGCQAQPVETEKTSQQSEQEEKEPDDEFELSLQSSVSKDQCFICGTPAGGLLEYYYKFDSIGIIHWADMSVTDTRIREYDDDGNEQINSGHMSTMVNSFGENYGSIMTSSQPDRCIAEPNIFLGEKDVLDCESLKDKLCQDCLDKVCEFYEDQVNSGNDEYLGSTGYCLIDFKTKELYTLSDPYRGYSIRDYMVRYDLREQGDGEKYIDLLIFCAPVRGEEDYGKEKTM